jgi:hypothetical protein
MMISISTFTEIVRIEKSLHLHEKMPFKKEKQIIKRFFEENLYLNTIIFDSFSKNWICIIFKDIRGLDLPANHFRNCIREKWGGKN